MTNMLKGRRLLLSEEGLKNVIGHWFEYCRAVSDIHNSVGAVTVVVAHRDCTDDIKKTMDVRAAHPETSWDGMHTEPNALKRYLGILTHNFRVWQTLHRVLIVENRFDIVFAPTVTIHHLLGWRVVSALRRLYKFDKLVLFFRNNAGNYVEGDPKPHFKRSTKILGWLINSFSGQVATGRVVLATDSERLADEYELLTGLRPNVFPSPRITENGANVNADNKQIAGAADAPLTFSSLGPARLEKGIDILQDAIVEVFKRLETIKTRRSPNFVIQWNSEIKNKNGEIINPYPTLIADRRINFIRKSLDSEAYNNALHNTDCMLLPYRRASYFARISGVAVEAATNGAPMIFTRDTWVAHFAATSGAGIATEDGDVKSVADAIITMLNDYPRYQTEAFQSAIHAQNAHSAEAFLRVLWEMEAQTKMDT